MLLLGVDLLHLLLLMWPFELAVPQKTYVIHHFCKVSPIILWQFFILIYTKQYGQGERRKWKRLEVEHNPCSHEEWGFTTGETIILILSCVKHTLTH